MFTRIDICNLESRDDGKRRERALGLVVNQPGGPEKSARIAKLYSLTNIIPDFPSDSAASKAIRGLKHGSQARGVLSTFSPILIRTHILGLSCHTFCMLQHRILLTSYNCGKVTYFQTYNNYYSMKCSSLKLYLLK